MDSHLVTIEVSIECVAYERMELEGLAFYEHRLECLDAETMESPLVYDDYILLTFQVSGNFTLEEVMDMLEDDMEMILLYHHIPSHATAFGHSACAYSNPAFGRMFKINARTDADGRVKTVQATLFDSLEQMCGEVCNDLALHDRGGHYQYRKEKSDVLLDFL